MSLVRRAATPRVASASTRRERGKQCAIASRQSGSARASRGVTTRATPNEVASALASTSGGLETARAIAGAATIALVLLQGPKGDGVVNSLNEGRVFGSASQAKSAVDYATYGLIGGFIVLSGVLAASG